MALELEWYDFVCFGTVDEAFLGALYVLWLNRGISHSDFGILGETLLAAASPDIGVVPNVLPRTKSDVNTSQLWTSCWRGVHPLFLLATRFCSFVVMAALLSLDVLEYDASIFFYYTEWTFTLVMIYFALGTTLSAYGCWKLLNNKPTPLQNGEMSEILRRDLQDSMSGLYKEANGFVGLQNRYVKEDFEQRAGFWGYLLQITYQTSAGAVVITDFVFWCVIVPFLSISHFKLNMLMCCMHTLNAAFILLDTMLNNLPFPWFRLAYFVLWSCAYVIFQWVIHACGFLWWPYLNTPWAPLWYFCLAIIHIPCYGVYSLIVQAKVTVLHRIFPHALLRPY